MEDRPIPEIRLRKSSDAPSLGSMNEQSPAPLASFEALSDLEESDDNAGAGTGATSPDSDVFPPPPPPEDAAAAGPDYTGYAPMEEEMDIEEEHMTVGEDLGSQELVFTDLGETIRRKPVDDTTPPGDVVHTASAWMDFEEQRKPSFDLLDEPPPSFDLDISAPATPDSDKTPTAEFPPEGPLPHSAEVSESHAWLEFPPDGPPPRPLSPTSDTSSPSRPDRPPSPSRPVRPHSPMKSPSRPDRPPSPMKSPSRPDRPPFRPDRPPSPMKSPSRPERPPSPYMAKSPSSNLASGYQSSDESSKRPPSRPPPPRHAGHESASEQEDEELEQHSRGLETRSTERPRSTTPISPAKFEDYVGLEESSDVHDEDKIKITLPGGGHHRQPVRYESEDGDEERKDKAPPKRPAPPPPAALKNLKKTAVPVGSRTNWDNFDEPLAPPQPGDSPPTCGENIGASNVAPNTVPVEDDSWLYDDDDALTTKKKKSKYGISTKKIIGGIQGIIDPYHKKKDKKKKQAGGLPINVTNRDRHADLEHFVTGKEQPKSEDWKTFQEMNARIQATVTKTKDTLKEIEGEVEQTVQQLNTATQNSPWAVQVMGPGVKQTGGPSITSPPDSTYVSNKPPSKSASWVGFEDSFDSAKHMEVTKNLPHLNVTPIPSPKHTPVPPYNSRRNSQDEEDKEETGEYLNLEPQQPKPPSHEDDLLGLSADITALSRNAYLNEDNKSSGAASPVFDQDIMALDGPVDEDDNADGSAQISSGIMDDFVDEFLGIKGSEPPLPPAPVPIATFLSDKTGNIMAEEDDDDPFGLGTLGSKTQHTTVVATGDLMGGIDDGEDIADPFAISDTTKAIAEGTANIEEILQQAQKLKTSVVSPTDDFDPRGVTSTRAAPVADDPAALWGSAVEAADNPFRAEMLEGDVIETFCHAESTNPFASAMASMNPFAAAETDGVDIDIFGTGDAEVIPDAGGFNPFATIHGDADNESLTADAGDTGFDPFQTIQDDDCFIDFPKKDAEMRDETDTKQLPPAVPRQRPKPTVGPPPIKVTTTSIKPVSRPKATTAPSGADTELTAFLPPPPKKSDVQVQEEESESEDEAKTEAKSSTNPFAAAQDDDELDPFAVFQRPAEEVLAEVEAQVAAAAETGEEGAASAEVAAAFAEPLPEVEEAPPEPLEPFHPPFEGDGWKMLLRQPVKKKLAGQRFWRPVYVRLQDNRGTPTVRVYENEESKTPIHELGLQPCYRIHNMGLQTFDQFGKCHTVKIEYVFYRERVGVKADRLAPTISDLVRVRNLKGFKDLVHRPKTTMILEHAKQSSELLKFGSLDYPDFKSFVRELEDAMFHLKAGRETKTMTYTKDEVTVDIQDEYYADIDKDGHILFHKARVRVFCLAFLTGMPKIEIGMNDKRRKGQEIVGRHDIIPIKTDEWIKLEEPEFHYAVERETFDDVYTVKLRPLDACRFEVMRFRARPKINKELPLQVRVQMSVIGKHIEIRADVMVAGYYSNSKRAAQTPCQDIAIRFPIPMEWVYMFRVEKRFRYGSVKSHTRKPGKIKGLERLTNIAQGLLPPSLIEVSAGVAKYENIFQALVWRIGRLPERNEGAYKSHLFKCAIDLGPHDTMPESFEKHVYVEYNMPNSMVSRAQVRSVSIENQGCEDPPDRWTHHLAFYEYKIDVEFVETMREQAPEHTQITPDTPDSDGPLQDEFDLLTSPGQEPEKDSDTSSEDEAA